VGFVRVHQLSSDDFLGDIVSALKYDVVASSVGDGYSVTCGDLVMEQFNFVVNLSIKFYEVSQLLTAVELPAVNL